MDRTVMSPLYLIVIAYFVSNLILPPGLQVGTSCFFVLFFSMEMVATVGEVCRQIHWLGVSELCLRIATAWRYPLLFLPGAYPADLFISASNQLAYVLAERQQFTEALTLNSKNVELLRERQPHSEALAAELICRANLFCQMADSSQALDAGEEALQILSSKADSQLIGMALNNLGSTYLNLGMTEQGLETLRKALRIKETLRPSQQSLGVAYSNVGFALTEAKQYAEAESFCRKGEELTKSGSPTLRASVLGNLGESLRGQGKLDEAEKLFNQALKIRQKSLSKGHRQYAESYHDLGKLMADRERDQQAEEYFLKAMEIRTHYPGAKFKQFNETAMEYVKLLRKLGRDHEAEGLISAHQLPMATTLIETPDTAVENTSIG
jgi:tetratricopeptide (TPR) repeat protein